MEMSTIMAKAGDVSVLKIAADMLEEAGWQKQADDLRKLATSQGRGLPAVIEIRGRRWFQRSAGNTYHTVRVTVDGEEVYASGKTYGYGDSYRDTAWDWLIVNGYLGETWRDANGRQESPWIWAEENGVQLDYTAEDVSRERDL
jgi:hypothetical protein